MTFRVLIIGGTGQVGAAVVRALAAEPSCAEVVMVNRRVISATIDPRVRQVVLDTAAAHFPAEVTKLAQGMVAQGDRVTGALHCFAESVLGPVHRIAPSPMVDDPSHLVLGQVERPS
jgi:nucleoside-diphosphate-sugar epimerase